MTETSKHLIGEEGRKAMFTTLYEEGFHGVAQYVARRGGTLEEAEDVFQDALILYYEKMRDGSLELHQRESAYLFGIARYLWNKRYRESMRYTSLDNLMADFEGGVEGEPWAERSEQQVAMKRIVRLLQHAGKRCMRLLTAYYYERLDMDNVASRFGFSGKRSATVQKFKCLQKVKQLVNEKSLQYEDFME